MFFTLSYRGLFGGVLIETYWNVNSYDPALHQILHIVLIETYWNVNVCLSTAKQYESSINRNILECKFSFSIRIYCSLTVLIETYWNVN